MCNCMYDRTQKDATSQTMKINRALWEKLLDGTGNDALNAEIKNARQSLLCEAADLVVEPGTEIWNQKAYGFLGIPDGEASHISDPVPPTVNPSLFVNGQNNHQCGLFQVTSRIFQVRGFDMANLTLVLGDTGWIVLDTLMSEECTNAAVDFAQKYFQEQNEQTGTPDSGEPGRLYPVPIRKHIKTIFISHSHVDHFGGIGGLIKPGSPVPVYVPRGFTEAAVSENVYVGQAMARRAAYQYGTFLKPDAKGSIAIGIGQGQSKGTVGFHLPVIELGEEAEETFPTPNGKVDGLTIQVQLTPGTEAPAEMNLYFKELSALWMAENCSGTLHNLYTLRGAQVRDANAWAKYLMESLARFGPEAQVVFQAHNWPHWNTDGDKTQVSGYILHTAMAYKYIHDQTLRYMNMGYTKEEIAEHLALPEEIAHNWYLRPYYGTPSHNVKAVYQKYLGWYDANPAHLNPLPPEKLADQLLPYLKSADQLLAQAEKDYAAGEYRLVAELANLLLYSGVFREEESPEMAERLQCLCADALEQLGYQAESGIWRNAYLSGAYELRNGTVEQEEKYAKGSPELISSMSGSMLLDYMGILFDDPECGLDFLFHLTVSDDYDPDSGRQEQNTYTVYVKSGTILYAAGALPESGAFPVRTDRNGLFQMTMPGADHDKLAQTLTGDPEGQRQLADLMKRFANLSKYRYFKIMEPRQAPDSK